MTNSDATLVSNNDNATQRVPQSEKKGLLSVGAVSAGYAICMSGMYTGAAIAVGLNLKQAIIAALIGNLILSLYGGAVGAAGSKEGVSTSMLARHSFGRDGSRIVGVLVALVMLGWFAVQVGFFGQTIEAMFPKGGFITQQHVAAFWGGIMMMTTAYFGYKGLNILSYVAVPLIAILAIVGMVFAVNSGGGWSAVNIIKPTGTMTLYAAIVAIVGSFAGGACAQADIARYAKTPRIAWISTFFGYSVGNVFIILAGYITSLATGEGDLPAVMLSLGLGIPALLILIMAQWTTNDNNLYTASLGFANTIAIPKKKIVLMAGILATIVGAMGLSDYFINWLVVLGTGLPPMAGIVIADYYFIKKGKYEYGSGTKYYGWNLFAFLSWAVAGIVGFAVKWGIASINSLVVGFVLYLIAMKVFERNGLGLIGKTIEE